MTRLHRAVIALAIAAGTAHAQPGAGQPPPQDAPPAGAPAPVEPSQPAWNAEAMIEQIAANVPALEAVAKGAFRRARRSISIGPTLGVYGAALPSPGELDYAITFGAGVELFKIPVLPTLANLKAIAKERAKAKLKQMAIDRFKGKPPEPGELEQMVREIWEEAVQEVLGLENIRAKTMERPRFTVAIEGSRLLSSETWATRLRLGVGVWKLTVAGSIGARFTDPDTGVLTGLEVVAHFLTSKNPRASVIDVFLRGDFEVRNRGTANTDSVVLGVRYLLDII